ncbi:MAG: 50S ribosomal protein L9 [Candidatus Omnitrophota bacterium]
MEVILLESVDKVGREGETVKVKDGYARNYLIPRKLAAPVTPGALKILESKKRKAAKTAEKDKKAAEELAKTIGNLSLTIPAKSGVSDVLFGSVTPDTIFHALQHEGVRIDKKNIDIEEPIRKLGVYKVGVKLHPEVKADLRIWVVKK